MRKFLLVLLVLTMSFKGVFAAEVEFDRIITEFRNGNFKMAAQLLEGIKEKDARVYYYLGLAYFKAGVEEEAKKNFLLAYYSDPKSRWGKAAYKNYVYIVRKPFNFLILAGLNYDSNISHHPDPDTFTGEGGMLGDIYFRSGWNFASFSSIYYAYSRDQHFTDTPSNDAHTLRLKFFRGRNELSLDSSYSMVGGVPYYQANRLGVKGGFFALSGRIKDYNNTYDHLDGYDISGSLFKKLSGITLSYRYTINEAKDREDDFSYHKSTGTPGQRRPYVFREVKTSTKYFLSSSYNSHEIKASMPFIVGDNTTIDVSFGYQLRSYSPENYYYRSLWLNDIAARKWYYWDGEKGRWVESGAPLGKKTVKSREDHRINIKASMRYKIDRNLAMDGFIQYINNRSNMGAGDISNYNWNKVILGLGMRYNF